jgi:hypothetical protein
MALAPHLDMVV